METRKGRYEATENFIILQATEGPGITESTANYVALYESDEDGLNMHHLQDYPTWEDAQDALKRHEKEYQEILALAAKIKERGLGAVIF